MIDNPVDIITIILNIIFIFSRTEVNSLRAIKPITTKTMMMMTER